MLYPLLIFSLSDNLIQVVDTNLMTNGANLDQLASKEAKWSVSTLFAKAGHIRVQQDQSQPKYLDLGRQAWANKADQDQMPHSDQDLHCLDKRTIQA